MTDAAGMVGGRYRLVRTIGQGGMGTVWQAHDEVLGRDVAVKEVLPPPDLTGSEREVFAVRTFREARAAGRVAHPSVAAVYDVLEERGHPWIVMQLVRSRTLGEAIREDGPMPPLQAARIGLQLLEALRAAHAAGVLHRDVKPDNVLLTKDGRAVLTDFGIATTEDEAPVTRTGILIGTPAYMAPERAAGGRAGPASDLWALGVTLYLAVEGESPFQRENALATLGAVMHAEPEPLSRAGALAPVLLGLLRKNPAERMSLEESERRLAAIIAGEAPEPTGPFAAPGTRGSAPPPAVPETARRRRGQQLAAVAGGALLVGLVTGGTAWLSHRPHDAPAQQQVPAVVTTPGDPTPTEEASSAAPSEEASPERSSRSGPVSRPGPLSEPSGETPAPPTARERPRTPSEERGRTTRAPKPTESAKKPRKTENPRKDEKVESPSRTPGQVEGSEDAGAAADENQESGTES
ncbi:serine/threonine protein kinase [Nonomuraea deserti]|uniref:non-specific serine/threonine protein kinase n=1 Tax=Nonomuraea deserti TaxID=1848322 RepID=A0A4R4VJS2_9ACTN|nr:serine/threonine-protein kinase [Nonomuraea deserti]TDD00120.1 serine/threonine protein kinase [Nonomuraea deserti]